MDKKNVLIGLVGTAAIALATLFTLDTFMPKHDCLLESNVTEIVEVRSKNIIYKSNNIVFETGQNVKLGDKVCLIFNGNDDFRLSKQIYINHSIQNPSVLADKLKSFRVSIK